MKRKLYRMLCMAGLLTCIPAFAQQGFMSHIYDYLENTQVFEQGQEEGHAYYIPQSSLSLNGKWKFFFADVPEGIPQDFYQTGFNDSKWGTIAVPSNWEMQGYGDKLFRNVHAPFKANPPHVPREYNPTGAYRTSFNLPADWNGQEVFLRFEKVASASFVWVNGQEVGYNEGAQEPSEYDITPYLKKGKNTVAVMVTKYSDGYYLEGQDYWRLAGIFDDVWVMATPKTRLMDWQVITDLDEQYLDADLQVKAFVKNYGASVNGLQVKALLTDGKGAQVAEMQGNVPSVGERQIAETLMNRHIANPLKWTSETPNLYALRLQLLQDGRVVDEVNTRIGFKETKIIGETFYLNGVPLKVNAQNSHMQHPEMGHAMTEDVIRKDFEILKQFNFNAVRTSHYPPVNKYLELADEYGLFVIDETGDEAHATEQVSSDDSFLGMYQERVRRMVLRDRNHPCVLFWSAGNESGEGPLIGEVIKEGKRYDPTRSWMYGGNAYSHPAEEIIGPRYPTPEELDLQVGLHGDGDIRPSFMDEYLSVAGNGGGGLDDFWRVIYDHPRTMGGAIWDFVSPGLTEQVRLLKDSSPYNTPAHLMGNARLVKGRNGTVLDLNGHDQWVEVYRADNVEISGDQLTITMQTYPRKLISSCGSFITKGSKQFGIQQEGKEDITFYIYTDKLHKATGKLPANWENNWHQLYAVYDGSEIRLMIDSKEVAKAEAKGDIRNLPMPLNIGRNEEIHGQETDVYICDAQIDKVGVFDKALKVDELSPDKSVLWLDFESETNEGTFFSYGIGARTYGSIWPDRTPQPEMWQMKKSVQPLSFTLLDAANGEVEVWNRNHYLPASHYDNSWQIECEGKVLASGTLDIHTAALQKEVVKVPYSLNMEAGKEYFLRISSKLKQDELWAKKGFEVSWDQLPLNPISNLNGQRPMFNGQRSTVNLSKNEDGYTITGYDFSYRFNTDGLLCSIVKAGKELLKEPLKLNVWRAPLANEQDQWNSWRALSRDMFSSVYGMQLATVYYAANLDHLTYTPLQVEAVEGDGKVYIKVRDFMQFGSPTVARQDSYIFGAQYNGYEENYLYVIHSDGTLTVNHELTPQGTMPMWLPRIGLTMTLDKSLQQVDYYGRGPQENYPDRKTGYAVGQYHNTVDGMYEPYLIPQDYGLRTDNRKMRLSDSEGRGIEVSMNELFNFNVSNYSTENLTKAVYQYQLRKQDGVTLNLDYATSGVGCTARAIFPAYRALPTAYKRIINIKLY
ncbi:MAG: DUF4981 domain-containing protein [Bacteroidaceae bacterium]|nr:DUF4981 domain-containing protein [Bacteroidaceae bacterium]